MTQDKQTEVNGVINRINRDAKVPHLLVDLACGRVAFVPLRVVTRGNFDPNIIISTGDPIVLLVRPCNKRSDRLFVIKVTKLCTHAPGILQPNCVWPVIEDNPLAGSFIDQFPNVEAVQSQGQTALIKVRTPRNSRHAVGNTLVCYYIIDIEGSPLGRLGPESEVAALCWYQKFLDQFPKAVDTSAA
jgi:hypothetical protein